MFHKKLFFCFLIICSSAYQINAQQKTFNKIKTYLNKKLNGISETITTTKKPSSSIPLVSAITKSIFNHPVDSLFYVCDIPLPASVTVASFYRKTYYKVVWVNDNGFNTQGLQFLIALSQADNNGLNASDYHLLQLNKLESKFSKNRLKQKPCELDDLLTAELLMTDAFMLYAAHLYYGKTDAETIDPQWHAERNNCAIEIDNYLIGILNRKDIIQSLKELEPNYPEYQRFKIKLQELRNLANQEGWQTIPFNDIKKIEPNDTISIIQQIRERMAVIGEYQLKPNFESEIYDDALVNAVKKFQYQNGLENDGVIGKGTQDALNITIQQRIQQLVVNMERMRWLPREQPNRYIMVNIAGFTMRVIENGKVIINSKAVVGRDARETPVFSAKMTYMVLNPNWTVPTTILKEDVIPAVKKNINYLAKKNMRIVDRNGKEIDPITLDWKNITPNNFKYFVKQDPGKTNSLGTIKFMFPNKYDVYIHDTPDKSLFSKTERAYSSGCIRIQEYLKLAAYLLKEKEITEDSINVLLESGKQMQMVISNPIMVHIVYFTASVNEKGEVIFRKDIYNRDAALRKALFKEYQN